MVTRLNNPAFKARPAYTAVRVGCVVLAIAALLIFAGCDDFFTKDIALGVKDSTGDGDGDGGTDTPDEVDDDNDGLGNSVEELFSIDPRDADTDQDGFSDGLEFVGDEGDPLNASDIPTSANRERILPAGDVVQNAADRDKDGLGDTFESDNSLDSDDPDTDGDGYQDGLELVAQSDPFLNEDRPSRDAAPAPDGIDRTGNAPLDGDSDGISDDRETRTGTTSTSSDSDSDGFGDGLEFLMGSDATSSLSVPNFTVPTPPAATPSPTPVDPGSQVATPTPTPAAVTQ